MDVDGSGKISLEEFQAHIHSLVEPMKNSMMKALEMGEMDKSKILEKFGEMME